MNWLAGTLAAAAGLALPAAAGGLAIEISDIRSDEGRVMVAVHAPADGVEFPDEAGALAGAWTEAASGTWTLTFPDLPDGRYAVAAIHDENGNGDLDTNLLGVPVEGYGFSNDALGFMGPPAFADAAVVVAGGTAVARVTLRY